MLDWFHVLDLKSNCRAVRSVGQSSRRPLGRALVGCSTAWSDGWTIAQSSSLSVRTIVGISVGCLSHNRMNLPVGTSSEANSRLLFSSVASRLPPCQTMDTFTVISSTTHGCLSELLCFGQIVFNLLFSVDLHGFLVFFLHDPCGWHWGTFYGDFV